MTGVGITAVSQPRNAPVAAVAAVAVTAAALVPLSSPTTPLL